MLALGARLPLSIISSCVHVLACACTFACVHACMHVQGMSVCACVYALSLMLVCMSMCACICMRTSIHACTPVYVSAHLMSLCAHTHVCVHARAHSHAHAHLRVLSHCIAYALIWTGPPSARARTEHDAWAERAAAPGQAACHGACRRGL